MSRTSLADRELPHAFSAELDRILDQHNHKIRSTTRVILRDCSTKTKYERRSNLRRAFAELYQLGYRLTSPTSLKPKHVVALAGHWRQKNLAAKTLHCLFSNLREFCRWIGKPGLVSDIGVYFPGREHFLRSTVAARDLSWEGNGVDVADFLLRAKALDQRLFLILSLARYFGLRAKEAIEFRPWLAVAIDDEYITVTHGTKGGKQRLVKIRNDQQRQLLGSAKQVVGPDINSRMRWPDKSWKQAQAHFYYLMRCLGATHKLMNISAHGLRHAFLQDEYQHYAKVPAPIKQAGVLPESKQDHERALLAVSLQAGLYRPAVSAGYCGSFGHQLRSVQNPSQK